MVTILPVVSTETLEDARIFQEICTLGACLISYLHFRGKGLRFIRLCRKLKKRGVKIVLDSGAFEAHTQKKQININDYIRFLKKFKYLFDDYINLDEIGNAHNSAVNLLTIRSQELKPMPVFHFEKSLALRKNPKY